eukprot:TRINITY_DN4725_c0_g2_i1.p1 TRINITY_DN4725_c0_g2~~TRINITY_DN4725_c0_g2_i1.p1  ORF type:complete len:680 (-),score=161.37 TRINITY_DN4725_c0_g2_i1:107-2146(-)
MSYAAVARRSIAGNTTTATSVVDNPVTQAPPQQTPNSLSSIINEEIAKKIQIEEEEELSQLHLQQALLFSKLEYEKTYGISCPNTTVQSEPIVSLDDDEALARKLAEEEDYKLALSYQKQYETNINSHTNEKVSVISQNGPTVQKSTYSHPQYDMDEPADAPLNNPMHHKKRASRRKGVVVDSSGAVKTKHDPEVSSEYNAENIGKFFSIHNSQGKDVRLPSNVYNSLKEHAKNSEKQKIRYHEKVDISTAEQTLDMRTRIMILKMLNSGILQSFDGVINTGKESNIYHATGGGIPIDENTLNDEDENEEENEEDAEEGENETQPSGTKKVVKKKHQSWVNKTRFLPEGEYAIKIFKTTLNEFKNRTEYLQGAHRTKLFRARQNTRKLIKTWARKELQNLHRIHRANIPSPTPHILRDHILVMEFIGQDGVPAPCLKDCSLSDQQLLDTYIQVVRIMRKMYQECRIVHADFSEYNLLYFEKKVYVIDVSQAVENDHLNAMDFLRRDCNNITAFYSSRDVPNIMTAKQLFEFVTDSSISSETDYLRRISASNANRGVQTQEEKAEENVFMKSFMPRTLSQVKNPEKDQSQQPIHSSVTGLHLETEKATQTEKTVETSSQDTQTTTEQDSTLITTPLSPKLNPVEALEDSGLTSGGDDDFFDDFGTDEDEDDLEDFVIVEN